MGNAAKNNRKTKKKETKQDLEDSIVQGEKHENEELENEEHENEELEEKSGKVEKSKDGVAVIRRLEDYIKSKKKNTWLKYQQGKIFQRFKEKEKFIKMITEFDFSRSTILLKILTAKVADKYQKVKK